MHTILKKTTIFLFWFLFTAISIHAAVVKSISSGSWSDPSIWDNGVVPAAEDDVIIQNSHVVLVDIITQSGEKKVICNSLTVEIDGVLRLGYNGDDLNRTYAITGDLICNGTLAAGREVPTDINTGSGLIYDNNSNLVIQLSHDSTSITGKGYLHPKSLIIQNNTDEKELNIDHHNLFTDENLLLEGEEHINLTISKNTYINVGGLFSIAGIDPNTAPSNLSASVENSGIIFAQNLNLFTKNASERSILNLTNEGVFTASNTINNGAVYNSGAGGFELIIGSNSIFRCGEYVFSPVELAQDANNLIVTNEGTIKDHYSKTLTSGTKVLDKVNAVDTTSKDEMSKMDEVLGASHIAGWYNFTEEPFLYEGKERFKEWGSKNIKTTISANNGKMFSAYPFNHDWPAFDEIAEVIRHPDVDSLFSDTYFKRHAFWAPSKGVNGYFKKGADRNHQRYLETEEQIYRAAKEILSRYGDMGKVFLFQNWEGDWMLRGQYRRWEDKPETIPDDIQWQIEGMARMWRAHIRGIDRAVAEFPAATSSVQYAVEFNKVFKNVGGLRKTMMELGVPSVVADVLPKVRMHISSWSAYDGNFDEPATNRPFPTGMWNGLEIAEYFTNDTKQINSFPVQIGEFALNENPPFTNLSVRTITDRYDKIARLAAAMNLPNVYIWNLYGSGQQSVELDKDVQYDSDFLYEVLDGKWVIEPDNSFGIAASHFKNYYFKNRNNAPEVIASVQDTSFEVGFGWTLIELNSIFSDPDGDQLTFEAEILNGESVEIELTGSAILLTEREVGISDIVVTAFDQQEFAADTFSVAVGTSILAVQNPDRNFIYPNPVSNSFGVNIGNGEGDLYIFSLDGKIVLETAISSSKKMDVKGLENGPYVVVVLLESGEKLTQKIIIR